MCNFIETGRPFVGTFSSRTGNPGELDEIRDIAADASPKSATKVRTSTPAEQLQLMETTPPDIIIQKLDRCGDWYEIYDDPILGGLAVHSYESLKKRQSLEMVWPIERPILPFETLGRLLRAIVMTSPYGLLAN